MQIILLIRYAGKVNSYLSNFLIHLKEENTSLNLSNKTIDHLFGGLTKELNKINEEFKKIENEKIRNKNFLNILLKRIGTGILVISDKNEIRIHNDALLELLAIEEVNETNKLKNKIFGLIAECNELKAGDQQIANVHINNITRRILIALSEIKEDNETLKIYSFHDIDREMTDYELQSWNGLIKVLSHEIMNTLTPMSTTTDTLKDCLTINGNEKKINELEAKDIQDAVRGINLLEGRITGLQTFIKKFRQFLDIPVPELIDVDLNDLIEKTSKSYTKQGLKIDYKSTNDKNIIPGDKDLIELVFINLIKNATEAKATEIKIIIEESNKQINVSLQDNGYGIDDSIIDKVFLPFYTTKEGGSGIGLSITRQIIYAHGGNIEIEPSEHGTCIKLIFTKNI